jgi:hypothetical protein
MWPSAVSVTVFVASLALLTGCGGSSEEEQPRAESSTSPAAVATPSDTPTSVSASPVAESSGPPPTTGQVHQLGDRVRLTTGSTMTVFTWQRMKRPGPPAAGTWWAADVRFCLTRSFGEHFQEPIGNIRSQLRAELPDGTALTPDGDPRSSDEAFAQPTPIVAGQCVRGQVVVDVPAGPPAQYFSATVSSFGWVRWQLS